MLASSIISRSIFVDKVEVKKAKMSNTRTNSPKKFEEALRRCHEVAEVEYQAADEALGRTEAEAELLYDRILSVIQELPAASRNEQSLPEIIRKVSEQLSHQIKDSVGATRRKLAVKRPRLQKFTIALFGRTMAGKSTFREAITGGDGASIGKGGQNTTKRVREYEWRGLHIIDTPGIGSYKGEHFRQQAISVVGKSDLVIFLLSDDGIQQEVFDGMQEVLRESKPVFFVLNVKRDLTKNIHRDRFLKNPESLLGRNRIDGHFRRIQKLAVDTLGCKEPRVFAIHAQAAHLSTQKKRLHAKALYKSSGMEELHTAICEEVATNGPIRRLQTLLDGTIGAIEKLGVFYTTQASKLKDEASFFYRRHDEFEMRASQFLKDQSEFIAAQVARLFQGLHDQVFYFIEENIERRDIGHSWQEREKAARIEENLKRVQQQAIDSTNSFITEFGREIAVDAEFVGTIGSCGTLRHADVWDIRRGFERVATTAIVLSGVASICAQFGAANVWNPLGLVLFGGSIVAGIFAWLLDKKSERLGAKREEARRQLHDRIDDQKKKTQEALQKWLGDEVDTKILKAISKDLGLAVHSLNDLATALRAGARSIRLQVKHLNTRLLLKLAEIRCIPTESLRFKKLVRSRSRVFRVVCTSFAKNVALSKVASVGLGENVVVIPDGQVEQIIRRSLHPVKPKRIDKKGQGFVVFLTKRQTIYYGRIKDALFSATRRIAGTPIKFKVAP